LLAVKTVTPSSQVRYLAYNSIDIYLPVQLTLFVLLHWYLEAIILIALSQS